MDPKANIFRSDAHPTGLFWTGQSVTLGRDDIGIALEYSEGVESSEVRSIK